MVGFPGGAGSRRRGATLDRSGPDGNTRPERDDGREHHQLTAGQQRWCREGGMQALAIAERDPHDVPICGEDRGQA